MKTRSLLLLLAILIILPGASYAQGAILRNRLNRILNKEVENKIDTAIEKSVKESREAEEKEERDLMQSDKATGKGNIGRKGLDIGLFGGKTDIKHNDEYLFTGRIYMQMESYENKKVLKSDYYTYFNSNTLDAGIEVRSDDLKDGEVVLPTIFLFDNDNRCFMMLIESKGSKTGIISTIPDDSTFATQGKPQKGSAAEQGTVTKTGNSRNIAGYRCDEYKITEAGKDGYSNVWMTKDVNLKADKKNWGKAGIPTFYDYPGFEGATMLAIESYDKSGKLETKMETKEINENISHSISTAEYAFIKMNFGQAGMK